MLAPELRDALRDGARPRSRRCWAVRAACARWSDAPPPAAAAALDRARGTTESRPTNNMSYATSVGVVVPRTADGPASLLVDEAGLGAVFDVGGDRGRAAGAAPVPGVPADGLAPCVLGPQAVSRPAPHHKCDGVAPQRRLRGQPESVRPRVGRLGTEPRRVLRK